MEMKLVASNKQLVLKCFIDNKGKKFNRTSLANASGVSPKHISSIMHRLVTADETGALCRVGWGEWVYSPHEPVEKHVPLTHRMHELLSETETGLTREDMAQALGTEVERISEILGRMRNELGVCVKRTTYYTLKE